ncbi:AhpC/TSA family protein [Flagellimonas sp. HMM57]|uniref:peroxiredoxin-like family protein n=1 Tax=unclassified Flagellimonas TaxID=2644544 RepID=UPI0013D0CBA5|nr:MULTISPECIES: peroxiredoxin-like family protein [unclassified Flagellimonas]UII76996.1 AhpC/TSA family protein [Flagellimonas sp. HMM57]
MTLTEELTKKRENSSKAIPQDKYAIMQQSTKALLDANISEKATTTGDVLPDFELPDEHENQVHLNELLQNEYLILSFYRGGWCPYCNMELRALQQFSEEFKKLGADLVAISPETPDNSLTTSEKNELQFKVLSDINNTYAKKLNLTFQMPENLKEVYHSFGLHVDKYNGNTDYELPMPATYVIDKSKAVVYHFVSENYTKRLDPKNILDFLKKK